MSLFRAGWAHLDAADHGARGHPQNHGDRFGQMPHLPYLFSGWIPILLEALVLFVRERTPRRAAWLGAAFFLNGLSVIHWLVLTLIPLAATGLALGVPDGPGPRAGVPE